MKANGHFGHFGSPYAGLGDEALLDALDREREKFTYADASAMQAMTDLLIARGVYPKETVPKNPSSVRQMVDGFGAHWHLWRGPLACPHCHADLRDHEHGPPFKREIAIEKNDRISHLLCPDCDRKI